MLGLDKDMSDKAMGLRSHRFALIVEDQVVKYVGLDADDKPNKSAVDAVLAKL